MTVKNRIDKVAWFLIIIAGFMLVIFAIVNVIEHLKLSEVAVSNQNYRTARISLGQNTLNVEIAETADQQTLGLGKRSSLPADQGMLFIFDQPQILYFWMKDMEFSLDIIWLDENYKVIGWSASVSPETFPETFSPSAPAKYVLEVNAGFVEKNSVKVGDLLKIL